MYDPLGINNAKGSNLPPFDIKLPAGADPLVEAKKTVAKAYDPLKINTESLGKVESFDKNERYDPLGIGAPKQTKSNYQFGKSELEAVKTIGQTGTALVKGVGAFLLGAASQPIAQVMTGKETEPYIKTGNPVIDTPQSFVRAWRSGDTEKAREIRKMVEGKIAYQPTTEHAKWLMEKVAPYITIPAILGNLLEEDEQKALALGKSLSSKMDEKMVNTVSLAIQKAGTPVRYVFDKLGITGTVRDMAKVILELLGFKIGHVGAKSGFGTGKVADVIGNKIKKSVDKFKAQFEEPLGLTKRTAVEQVPEAKIGAVIPEETKVKINAKVKSEEAYQAEAAKEGVIFNGMQESKTAPAQPMFTDPQTKSTFMLNKDETLPEAIARKREQFTDKELPHDFTSEDAATAATYWGNIKPRNKQPVGEQALILEARKYKTLDEFESAVFGGKINDAQLKEMGIEVTGGSKLMPGNIKFPGENSPNYLTDIWNKAQEGGSGTPKGGIPEPPKSPLTKPAKAALDINKKLAEKGLEQLPPEELAQYGTIEKESIIQKVSEAVTTDEKLVVDALMGKKPMPQDVHPQVAFNMVEKLAQERGDFNTLYDLAKSTIAEQRSIAAQTLGASAWEKLKGSFVEKLKTIKRERGKQIKADPEKVTKAKRQIHEETKKVLLNVEELSWNKFLKDIVC